MFWPNNFAGVHRRSASDDAVLVIEITREGEGQEGQGGFVLAKNSRLFFFLEFGQNWVTAGERGKQCCWCVAPLDAWDRAGSFGLGGVPQ
jgi:hypothetical protein